MWDLHFTDLFDIRTLGFSGKSVYALSYNETETEVMIYIRNADRFDPANAVHIGMITSPNNWSNDETYEDANN